MPLFRCLNCSTDFEAAKPACAECGLDASKNPRDGDYVIPRQVIHFDPPTKVKGRGKNYAACNRSFRVGGGKRFSGETEAVTCDACKATTEFAAALDQEPGMIAMPLNRIGPKGGVSSQ